MRARRSSRRAAQVGPPPAGARALLAALSDARVAARCGVTLYVVYRWRRALGQAGPRPIARQAERVRLHRVAAAMERGAARCTPAAGGDPRAFRWTPALVRELADAPTMPVARRHGINPHEAYEVRQFIGPDGPQGPDGRRLPAAFRAALGREMDTALARRFGVRTGLVRAWRRWHRIRPLSQARRRACEAVVPRLLRAAHAQRPRPTFQAIADVAGTGVWSVRAVARRLGLSRDERGRGHRTADRREQAAARSVLRGAGWTVAALNALFARRRGRGPPRAASPPRPPIRLRLGRLPTHAEAAQLQPWLRACAAAKPRPTLGRTARGAGVSERSLWMLLSAAGIAWPRQVPSHRDEAAGVLRSCGWTLVRIGRALGVSRQSALQRLQRLARTGHPSL